jgi:prephenate dehydrogenase
MPDKLQVTIIGLGLIGTSAGLALRRYADRVYVVGHDPDASLAGAAKKAGAVDRTDWNLIAAVSGADRILLALPPDQVRDTLKIIAGDLKQGCVVLDTADVKASVMAWAAEFLPAGVHFVGGHPILVLESLEPGAASADLFENKLFCLTPDVQTDAAAVQLAADLVQALGAKPFFLDAAEHDGMIAAVVHLPQLLAGALMDAASGSSGWKDMRKLAGSQFYTSTLITEGNGKSVVAGLVANREHVMLLLDELMARLDEWRQLLADDKEEAVAKAIDGGLAEGQKWMSAYLRGSWDESQDTPPLPSSGTMFRDLFGFGKWRTPADRAKGK